jgi:hypothetical protein
MEPSVVLRRLLQSPPVRLDEIPDEPGIYALYDHLGRPLYIGITAKSLNDRILKRHAAGDGNSHKFSSIYNAGRMFHDRRNAASCPNDGRISKELRRMFARQHCRAVAIPLPGLSKDRLTRIEAAVLAQAPVEAKSWNDARALDAYEPSGALDTFIATLGWSRDRIEAIERQAVRWARLHS